MYGLYQAERILQGMDIGVPAGQKLSVMRGGIVRMTVAFNYRGTALNCTLYCSIGSRILGVFDEIAVGTKVLSLPQSIDFVPYTAFADIDTSPIGPGTNYDIYCKIKEYPGAGMPSYDNVIDVIGAPEFADFAITSYEVV